MNDNKEYNLENEDELKLWVKEVVAPKLIEEYQKEQEAKKNV